MLTQLLFQILQRTPVWVYGLFFGLLALGYLQSKPREIGQWRLATLPLAFCAFSLAQVWLRFSTQPPALAAWVGGIAIALLVNRALKQPAGAGWSAANGTFHVPGSWAPLALMMAIFLARYALNVSLAMTPELAQDFGFAAGASFGFGLLSGAFLARALWVRSQRPAVTAPARAYDQA
jgi:hypothetical protein